LNVYGLIILLCDLNDTFSGGGIAKAHLTNAYSEGREGNFSVFRPHRAGLPHSVSFLKTGLSILPPGLRGIGSLRIVTY
jgi:hypothetical protein